MFLRGMYAFEEEQTCSLLLSRLHARSRASVVLAVVAQSAVFARRVGSLGHIVLEGAVSRHAARRGAATTTKDLSFEPWESSAQVLSEAHMQ